MECGLVIGIYQMDAAMINKIILIISIIISSILLAVYIFSWTFLWNLMEVYPINILIIDIFITVITIIFFIINIKKIKTIIPMLINIITLLLIFFIPFRNLTLIFDIENNFDERNKIIENIEYKNLNTNSLQKMELPFASKYLSKDGGEIFINIKNENLFVLFFTFRGVLDNFSGLVYSSNNNPPDKNIFGGDLKQIIKEKDNWYWIASW